MTAAIYACPARSPAGIKKPWDVGSSASVNRVDPGPRRDCLSSVMRLSRPLSCRQL